MVRQFEWNGSCSVCFESMAPVIHFACCPPAPPAPLSASPFTPLTGHSFCFSCAEDFGIQQLEGGSELRIPYNTGAQIECPVCRGEVIHAIRAVPELIAIESETAIESEIVAIVNVGFSLQDDPRAKVRWTNSEEDWVNIEDLKGTRWEAEAQEMFDDEFSMEDGI